MNDQELELRLRRELQARITPPAVAPPAVYDQLRYLRSMRGERLVASPGRPHTVRNLFAVAALVLVAMLVASGILLWRQPKMAASPSASGPTATPTALLATPSPRTQLQTPEPGVIDLRLRATTIDGMGRVNARVGWVRVGDPDTGVETLWFTSDGGKTWSSRASLPALLDPQFIDARNGWFAWWLSGSADVYRTIDGGQTWSNVEVPLDHLGDRDYGMDGEFSVHFRDGSQGELFAPVGPFGEGGALDHCQRYSTTDGGETWSGPKDAPCMGTPTFTSSTFGWAQGPLLEPTIHVTLDGGRTWVSGAIPGPANPTLQLVERRSDGTLRAMVTWYGTSATLTSKDGLTWTTANTFEGFDSDYRLAQVGEGRWYALGRGPDLRVTRDGGATWQESQPDGLGSLVFRVQFVSPTDGWAVGADNVCSDQNAAVCDYGNYAVYATTDGGVTWQPIFTP
jgi:hypothetical protein